MCTKKSRLNCFGRDFCGACQGAAQTAPAAKSPADRGKGVNGACGNVVIQERSESGSVVGALIQVAQLLGLLHHGGHQHFGQDLVAGKLGGEPAAALGGLPDERGE